MESSENLIVDQKVNIHDFADVSSKAELGAGVYVAVFRHRLISDHWSFLTKNKLSCIRVLISKLWSRITKGFATSKIWCLRN